MVKLLILGIGNPIMGDDGVGIHVARKIRDRFQAENDIEVKELSVGGLKLVEEILGYDEVIIVDSYAADDILPGQIREFKPEEFKETVHVSFPHGTNFATALNFYRELDPLRVPKRIRVFTIDITPTLEFREGLSQPISTASAELTVLITREIDKNRRLTT
jgi:hydrogenase maturation protease